MCWANNDGLCTILEGETTCILMKLFKDLMNIHFPTTKLDPSGWCRTLVLRHFQRRLGSTQGLKTMKRSVIKGRERTSLTFSIKGLSPPSWPWRFIREPARGPGPSISLKQSASQMKAEEGSQQTWEVQDQTLGWIRKERMSSELSLIPFSICYS